MVHQKWRPGKVKLLLHRHYWYRKRVLLPTSKVGLKVFATGRSESNLKTSKTISSPLEADDPQPQDLERREYIFPFQFKKKSGRSDSY